MSLFPDSNLTTNAISAITISICINWPASKAKYPTAQRTRNTMATM